MSLAPFASFRHTLYNYLTKLGGRLWIASSIRPSVVGDSNDMVAIPFRLQMSNWLSPALAGLGQKAASLFVLFCGACVSTHSLRRLRRVYSHSSLPPRSLCTERGLLLHSSVCSCAFRRIRPRTAFRSFLSCLSAATRSCWFLFAFFISSRLLFV